MKVLDHPDKFVDRHIGVNDAELSEMVRMCGVDSVDKLIDETIPQKIRLRKKINLSAAINEHDFIRNLREIASKNKIFKSYIGMGYHPVKLPPVIQRNILENPSWYTQYTPYQAEIAQGRLEALLNFQTVISDLTAMGIANASLLDEGTAAAEAMNMFHSLRPADKKNSNSIFVSQECFPPTIDILKTRANPLGVKLVIGDPRDVELNDDMFAVIVQYPSGNGEVRDYSELFEKARQKNIFKIVIADLLSLTLLKPPGEFGADAVVGSSQRLGVPMNYGGPHAAYFATLEKYKRSLPGRIIGVSVDVHGNRAYRMALQTREQHIRRERATSNICTAQVLLAVIAGMYAVYHGPINLKAIASRIRKFTLILDKALEELGFKQLNKHYFDTLLIETTKENVLSIRKQALLNKINFRYIDDKRIGISLNEVTDLHDVKELIELFSKVSGNHFNENKFNQYIEEANINQDLFLLRESKYLEHPVFNLHHSETELLRYMKMLENRDLSLAYSMTPLGSCTMKLNAASEMVGITWPEFTDIHPFAPVDQAEGYQQIFKELEADLSEITGFSGVTLQPNSGAQGEFAGLMIIRQYHLSRGEANRNVVLIPFSAHGTNPASAVMAGMKVIVINCDERGNIDINDLKLKAQANKNNLSALMITYPSTHGVFEENVIAICNIIHENGGQVYMDGANMNAQVGLTSPAMIGADVCHLNLHKTFCIPHGGGGPGAGPVAVAEHLVKFLPGHSMVNIDKENSITAVSSAPWGSAVILIISYAYIKMMGPDGLTKASEAAIVNANYMMAKLQSKFKVLYTGLNGRVAHELIFDMRQFKQSANVDVEDIAKRLMDYGFHAPTVSFPVPGTLMVEPTESESRAEIDRYCYALLSIHEEISEIENGHQSLTDNLLKNSPHTLQSLMKNEWTHGYSREKAGFPTSYTKEFKFWPSVGRVDSAYGDRNLICSCISVSEYAESPV